MPSHTAYELVLAAFGANLPFGAYRSTVRRLGWRWFLAIHVPIPAIFLLRTGAGYSYWFIPWLFLGAVGGQLLGARILRMWRARRKAAGQAGALLVSAATLPDGREAADVPADYEALAMREDFTTGSD
jgi:hypothetical protein